MKLNIDPYILEIKEIHNAKYALASLVRKRIERLSKELAIAGDRLILVDSRSEEQPVVKQIAENRVKRIAGRLMDAKQYLSKSEALG